jgi:rhodanese-related sulfurtransferase
MKKFNLDTEKFYERYNSCTDAVLLDVRTADEYYTARIPNSILIDYYQIDFIDKIKKLDKTKTYFVYCRSGRRSLESCYLMSNLGFENVYNLQGGILEWNKEIVRG